MDINSHWRCRHSTDSLGLSFNAIYSEAAYELKHRRRLAELQQLMEDGRVPYPRSGNTEMAINTLRFRLTLALNQASQD